MLLKFPSSTAGAVPLPHGGGRLGNTAAELFARSEKEAADKYDYYKKLAEI